MNRFSHLLGATALVAGVALAAAPAHANYIASFTSAGLTPQVTSGGVTPVTSNTATLNGATGVTFGSTEYIVSGTAPFLANPGGYNPLFGAVLLAITPLNVTFSSATGPGGHGNVTMSTNFVLDFLSNGVYWVATALNTVPADAVFTSSATQITINLTGTLQGCTTYVGGVCGGIIPSDTQSFLFSDSFTQSGPGANISESGSFVTPSPVPEPITLSLLGVGLAGIAAIRRRRTSI